MICIASPNIFGVFARQPPFLVPFYKALLVCTGNYGDVLQSLH